MVSLSNHVAISMRLTHVGKSPFLRRRDPHRVRGRNDKLSTRERRMEDVPIYGMRAIMFRNQFGGASMAKIKHIAITCEDPDAVAKFYKEGFDLFEVARNARQIQLSDGDINLTILKWKTDEDADVGPNGENYSGIHHIGFQVDSLEDTGARLRDIHGEEIVRREVAGDGEPRLPRAEEKWSGPNGQVLDISEPGWLYKLPLD